MAVVIKKGEGESLGKSLGVQSTVTLVKSKKVTKAEGDIISSNALVSDDLFESTYFDIRDNPNAQIIRPPFNPITLAELVHENNAVGQCVAAMEVNIDGTGYDVDSGDPGEETDDEKDQGSGIKDFFDEMYPGKSFITIRRALRRDQESTGNSYLEVLRSVSGEIVFTNNLEAVNMRIVKLDDPVPVEVVVNRFGADVKLVMMKRERRYVQLVGSKFIYFKEFGSTREINKWTGVWQAEGEVIDANARGTEVLHFYPNKDTTSPYGLPRWINQLPSILGSRKAEELNLDFFNAGGLPPVIIAIQGGELTEPVRKQLNTYLSGKGASKHRAAIIELNSTGGDLNSAGNVRLTVERFGAERQQDSMFENYDSNCEKRVRTSFRLPPLFVGKADDYSFSTAFASYTVAEAQVFQPERNEFDEIMNNTIMKEIAPGFVFRSLPLSVRDTTQQLKGIDMVKGNLDVEGLFKSVNEITNMNLRVPEGRRDIIVGAPIEPLNPIDENGSTSIPNSNTTGSVQAKSTPVPPTKVSKQDPMALIELARKWAGINDGSLSGAEAESIHQVIKSMDFSERTLFDSYIAIELMSGFDHDPEGAVELMSAATEIMNNTNDCCGHDH